MTHDLSENDVRWIARARELALKGRYTCSPNPMVGALVVADGTVVGEGYHARTGGPHAEIVALRAAGEQARGANLYVTLEPCSTHGRTPPCTDAIRAAGIQRVVVGTLDPNPAHSGRGLELLRETGIAVVCVDDPLCRELNERFNYFMATGLPFVHAKWAMSLDGRIATSTGESRWISGPESRAQAHRLRSECDAVMVGIGTVLADDPQLNVRLDGEWRQPAKIIVDSTCRTPVSAAVLVGARTIIAHTHAAPHEQREALAAAGAVLWEMPAAGSRVDLAQLLACMGADGLTSVLVEGGGSMLGTLIERKLVQRVTVFIAPNLIGGATAPGPVMGVGIAHMADVPRLARVATQRFGDDIMITGLVAGSQAPQP